MNINKCTFVHKARTNIHILKCLYPENAHLKALSSNATITDSDSESKIELSTKKPKASTMNRFHVVTDEKLAVMSKGYIYVPGSIRINTDWALKVFVTERPLQMRIV